ncbi:MAG: hypothetical protein DGJ47_000734 [Rickettsiaceae bacterium]
MSEVITLATKERSESGTGFSRELRRKGLVPVVVYGAGKKPMSFSVEEREITKYYRKPMFLSQQFDLEVDGKKHRVLPKAIQLHPITEIVRHVDFVFVEKKEQKMEVPVVYTNRDVSIGLKRGGYFNIAKRTLNILCPVKSLPRSIEVDIAKLKIGESIKASSVILPEGAKLLNDPKFVIASIIGKKGKSEESEESEAAETPAS